VAAGGPGMTGFLRYLARQALFAVVVLAAAAAAFIVLSLLIYGRVKW